MDKKKIALIVVVLFLLIGLGSFVFANPDQDNDLEGPGVSEDGGSGDGEVIDGTEPTATPEEENDDSVTETDPITTYGNGGNGTGTGTGAGNNGTTGGVGNTDMSQYDDARRIIEELENRVNSMQNKDDSNDAVDYRTDTDIIDMVNNLPDGTVKDELMNRLDAINKVLDDATAPVITGINNNDVTKENVTINVTDDNDVTITATLDGEKIEFTTPLTEEGNYVVTVTDKNFNTTTVEFTIDKTPIALDWLYVLNNSGTDYKVIGDGQKLYVELVFSEEFTSTPMIQIGNAEAVEMSCHWTNWQTEKQYFKCDATITIDGSTMGLENGKEVPVQITNVLDTARNETVLTNENITETEKYGHVIYDKQAPEMEVLRLTNVSRKDENGAWLQVAKAGDIVRVIVQFNENLATLPTLKVNGTEVGVMKYDSNMQSYTYDYKVTENDVNGVMQIEISNYADAAGNVGVRLTNEDINHDTQNQVVIDTVAPEYEQLGIVDHVEWQDEVARAYAKLGDEVRVMIYFKELLAVNPTVKLGGKEFTATHRPDSDQNGLYAYYADIVLTEDMNLAEGIIPFEVYGYADATGNVGETLTETMVKNTQYESVTFDSILPVLEGLTDGMYTNRTISLKISDANWDHIHVNQVGVKEFDEYREWTGLLDDGIYKLQAFDKAGNASGVITVTKDSVAPSMKVGDTVYGPDTTEVIYTNERFTADAIDELSGIDKIYANGYERPRIDVSGESSYTFTLVDKAGNESKFYVVIDKTEPTITGVEDGKQYLHEVTPVISDNNIDTITLNDESFVSGTTITADGKYTLKVTDKAGNSTTIEFRIGRIKTSIELIEPDNMVYDGTAKKFTARLVDEDGNVIDSVNITPVYIDANGDKGDAINAGTYTVRAYFDQNDQYATAYVSKNFVIEKATPTVEFTAPADMVYDGSAKQYTITVLGVNDVNITEDASMVVTYKKRPENVELNYIPSEIGQYSLSVMVRESDNYKQVYDYINYEILPVATVDGIAYGDLQEAINNANGKTVKLASDLNLNKQILVSNGNNVTLDLAGHNISFALKTNFKVSGGTLNVIGKGTIKEDKPYFSPITVYGSTDSNAKNYSTVVIGKDVTLIGWSGLFIDYVSGNMAAGVNVEVNGTLQSVPDVDGYDGHGIYLQGSVKNKANYPIITVNQTAKVLSGGPGIYAAGYAQWNINGAYIEGESAGIAIKSGIFNMNAGTIKAYGKDDTPTEGNGNGVNSSGTAIQVESNSDYAGDIEININGGSIISENSAAFYEYLANRTVTTNVKSISIIGGSFVSNETKDNFIASDIFDTKFNQFITGGTYSTDPTRYVKNGYKVIQTADNTFTVVSE